MFHVTQNYEVNQYRIDDIQREVKNDQLVKSLAKTDRQFNIRQYVSSIVQRFQSQTQSTVQTSEVRQLRKA